MAAAVTEIFIELNGAKLKATNEEVVSLFLNTAAGELSREEVEEFFIQRVIQR